MHSHLEEIITDTGMLGDIVNQFDDEAEYLRKIATKESEKYASGIGEEDECPCWPHEATTKHVELDMCGDAEERVDHHYYLFYR